MSFLLSAKVLLGDIVLERAGNSEKVRITAAMDLWLTSWDFRRIEPWATHV